MATLTTSWQNIASWSYTFPPGNTVYFYLDAKYSTQSIANNTTDIQTRLNCTLSGGSASGAGYTYTCSYAPTVSGSGTWNFENEIITSGGGTITHNSDGTKTLWLGATAKNNYWGFNGSFGANVDLPRIPRQANLSTAQDFTDEGNPTITYTNSAGNSVSELVASIYNTAGSIAYASYRNVNKTGTLSYTFNLTEAERTALRQACTTNSMQVRFYLRTYIGGTYYYSYIQKTMTIVNGNPTFTDVTSIVDSNSITTALTGDNTKFIKGVSNALITIDSTDKAVANKEATMSSYVINGSSQTYADDFTYTLNNVSADSITIYASDSRGNSTPVTKTIDLINYEAPNNNNNNLVVVRQNNVGSITNASFSGTWWNDNFGNSANSLSISYRYKTTDSQTWTTGTAPTLTINGNTFSFNGYLIGDQQDNGFNINEAYNIEITVSDRLSQTTFTATLNTGKPAIAVYKNKVSIGSKYDTTLGGKLQVDGYLVCCYEVVEDLG